MGAKAGDGVMIVRFGHDKAPMTGQDACCRRQVCDKTLRLFVTSDFDKRNSLVVWDSWLGLYASAAAGSTSLIGDNIGQILMALRST